MSEKLKRITSIILSFTLIASMFIMTSVPVSALSYSGSASYMSGKYYRALTSVQLTGNQRTDIVNVAKSQIGYQEGSNSSQLSGEVLGSANYTEYGRWYGLQDMWCAMFVSWCANTAGISTSIVPKHCFTPSGLSWFQSRGLAYSRATVAAGGYKPQPGDIIYFKSPRNSNTTNHIGIVTSYSGSTVYTIEGNTSSATVSTNGGAVAAKSYSISNTYIVYICKPNYTGTNISTGTDTETNPTAKALTFDANYYANKYADLKSAYGTNEAKLYEHFRNCGIKEGRQAHPCFNIQYYLNNYDDLKSAFGSNYTKAYEHYITTGYKEYHRVATAEPANLGAEFLANISFSSKNFSLSGDNVILYTPSSAPAQIWRFVRQSNGSYKIINTKNGKLLDAAAGTDNSGANIGICDGNETRAQRWFLYSKNGKYVLRPECARLTVADVTGASTSDLTNIQQYTYNGSDAQMFDIKKIDADAPKISNVTISDVTFSGYKVTCTVTSAVSIKEVRFATWSKNNGQDDLVWSNGTISGNTVTYYVNTNEHNYEFGDYYTHIYAYDNAGKYSSTESGATVPESVLSVSNIAVSEVTPSGYRVTCTVNSNAGIKEVRFATWTANNEQDDLVWSTGTVNGNEVTYYVDIKDHNSEKGNYITHVYAYDKVENVAFEATEVNVPEPFLEISDVVVSELTSNGYRVTCKVNSNVGIKEVKFATWTENNDQDDLVWQTVELDGNTATYYVDIKDHNSESGNYITHIYAFDNSDNSVREITSAVVPEPFLEISDITVSEVTSDGYRVTCTVNSNAEIKQVRFAAWTEKDGQDDLFWGEGTVSGNTATYYVDIKDHNGETGNYVTHIYAYDTSEQSALEAAKVTIPDPTLEISDITISEITSDGYRVTCKVTADKGIKEIKFATWTENNAQDDIIWSEGTLDENTVTYYVSANDHNNETGNYITHIYAFDNTDRSVSEEAKVIVPEPILEITDVVVSEITSEGYRVTCTVNSDKGIKEVKFPTWTESNGQDDIIWYDGTVNGNKATCYVNVKNHNNETGKYITDIYAYDNEGKFVFVTSSANVPEQATDVPPETKPEETKPEETKPEETVLYGDINNDGLINVVDATLAQKYAVDLINLSDDQIKRADVNFDGIVNVHDSTLIRKYAAEIILSFK